MEKAKLPDQAIPAAPAKTVESGLDESKQSIFSIVVSETKKETELEKSAKEKRRPENSN